MRRLISPLSRFSGLFERNLVQWSGSGTIIRHHVILGLVDGPGEPLEALAEAVDHRAPLPVRRVLVLRGEDGAYRRRHHDALARPDVGQQASPNVDPTALAGGVQDLAAAALKPSCASEIKSCTSRRPRRVSPNSLAVARRAGLSAFYTTSSGITK